MNDDTTATQKANATPSVFTLDDLERIEKTISAAPVPERPLTTTDALAALAPALSKARDRGHSLASLVQLCTQQGLHVSERSVSRSIGAARASKPARKKNTGGTKLAA